MKYKKKILLFFLFGISMSYGQCFFEYDYFSYQGELAGSGEEREVILGPWFEDCDFELVRFGDVPSWATLTKELSDNTFKVHITVAENPNSEKRSGQIEVLYNGYWLTGIYLSQYENCRVYWWLDRDNDGFGERTFEGTALTSPVLSCTEPSPILGIEHWAPNNYDACPDEVGTHNGCIEVTELHENSNWIRSKTYDILGNLRAKSKSYFNALGKATQSQTFDAKTERIWARQILYDSQGRPALQTLSAPISDDDATTPETFQYKEDFIRNKGGAVFSSADFEGSPALEENPKEVQSRATTYDLGRQYSAHNTEEQWQDITTRPYTRTLYSTLNPGTVLKTIGGNKIDTDGDGAGDAWKQGFSYTFPAAQEMYYAFGIDGIEDAGEILDRLPEPTLSRPQNLWANGSLATLATDYYYGSLDDVSNERAHALNAINANLAMDFSLLEGVLYYQENEEKFIKAKGKPVYSQFQPGPSLLSTNTIVFQSRDRAQDFLDYESRKQQFEAASSKNNLSNWLKANKTVVQDIHGVETVVFADTDGKTLAAARCGGSQQYEVLSLVGKQKYVDIHIPVGCGNTTSFVGASRSDFIIYNLRTEELVSSTNLAAGFYRIQYRIDNDKLDFPALSYIDENSNTIEPLFSENIGVRYQVNYYDFALHYYDRAGRLVKSTQPLGFDATALTGLKTASQLNHSSATTFEYNSLGQLLSTTSPDQGSATFKYRKDGQIRFSQNSKQAAAGEFSYTNYDALARPVESGVAVGDFSGLDSDVLAFAGTIKPEEQQETVYDIADTAALNAVLDDAYEAQYQQRFVAGNVSKTQNNQTTTWYSYDIYGRVEWLVQNITGLGVKTIDYEYDPVTSAVTKVDFQRYSPGERFVHHYSYHEVSGELIQVQTSEDGNIYITHASYDYYETGALKRLELKDRSGNKLQGIDYVYNLAGQLKAINHPELDGDKDPGGDTDDAFGMVLDYYQGDYQRNTNFDLVNSNGVDQYNGNIKAMTWSTRKAEGFGVNTYYYKYNKNNWLEGAGFNQELSDSFSINDVEERSAVVTTSETVIAKTAVVLKPGFHAVASNGVTFTARIANEGETTQNATEAQDYSVTGLAYDANGNLQALKRNGYTDANGDNAMDDFSYHYDSQKPNQLNYISDANDNSNPNRSADLKNQAPNTYLYSNIGQLSENRAEGIKYVYTASGLVSEVQKNDVPFVRFYYNDKGFRVRKEVYTNGILSSTHYYVRDVAGSVMAIYSEQTQIELPIYGASRLGIYHKNGATNYELTDHLGNVRAVVTKDNPTPSLFADYYPGGMQMPNRNVTGDYRYAYQGQEKDPETGKEAFQLRLYDSRINRWLTTDPYGQYSSPYVGMGNDWINGIDPDGGYRTWFGALRGWIAGGFKGSIDHVGGAGNKDYAISTINNNGYTDSDGDFISFSVEREYGGDQIYKTAKFPIDFAGGVKDFHNQYSTMKDRNFKFSDKYFHSKANFKATLRGPGGEYAAEKLSNLREITDQRLKGDSRQSSLEDQEANKYGRERAKHYRLHGLDKKDVKFKEAIPQFRPKYKGFPDDL